MQNGKNYEAERNVSEAEKIDKIIFKSFCDKVQTKNVITFKEASNITSLIIHENGILLTPNKMGDLLILNKHAERNENQETITIYNI